MSLSDIKDYIINNLLRLDGKINSAITRREYFKQSQEYSLILQHTSFLDISAGLSERLYCILNDISSVPHCVVCHLKPCVFSTSANEGYRPTCGDAQCRGTKSSTKSLITKQIRYGSGVSPLQREMSSERMKVLNSNGTIRQKIKEKYGVESILDVEHVREKIKKSIFERYGVSNVSQISTSVQKRKTQRVIRYTKLANDAVDIFSIVKRDNASSATLYNVTFECKQCKKTETMFSETFKWRCLNVKSPCSSCSGIVHGSAKQHELYSFISDVFAGEIIMNDCNILRNMKRELDIFIPSLNLAFEFDGLFWHSFREIETPQQRNLHLHKTEQCEAQGIQLVHIFENEWDNKRNIVESCIRGLLKKNNRIFARKCTISKISKHEAGSFIDAHHLQGKTNHSSHHYGLFHNGNLVSVMSFGKPRFDKTVEWELLRFCSILNTQIIGGASKLFNYFIQDVNPNSVLSYSDRRWSTVNNCVYRNLGFELVRKSNPSYYYFKSQEGSKLFNRISFQKHKLKNKIQHFDSAASEAENMFTNGYRRIWDCGNGVWVWTKDNTQKDI